MTALAERWDSIDAGAAARKPPKNDMMQADSEAEAVYQIENGLTKSAYLKGQKPDFGSTGNAPLAEKWDKVGAEAPVVEASAKSVPDQAPQAPAEAPKINTASWNDSFVGGLEAAGSVLSGVVAAPAGAAAGLYRAATGGKYGTPEGAREAQQRAGEVSQALTYSPRTQSGQNILSSLGSAFEASKLGGLGPTEAMAAAGTTALPRARPAPKPVAGQMGSVGAAGATPEAQASALTANSSPELRAVAAKAGNKVSLPVLERQVEADSLPVPMKLSRGQATQDPVRISEEMNLRGKHQEFADRFNEQNKQLIENTNAIREAAAPDVYVQSKPEQGGILIDAYKAKDAALNANISSLYKKLSEANGGAFPLDGVAFVDAADAALHKQLLFDHVPAEFRKTLDRLRDGGKMTFENFESLRTNLARVQRSQTADGNAKAAAATIRNSLEDLPMPPGAEHLKPLADAARSAAKERFALIEADPAYKAVTTGKASADKFIDKHVISSDLKNVEKMKENLAHDPVAQQTMGAGVINHLKEHARIGAEDAGNFSQAGYNKALDNLRPKLGVLFQPENARQLETVGRVARYTQLQPRGSFVNSSNTFVGAAAEAAKASAEGAANVALGGVPVGTWSRKIGGALSRRREINQALQTGAGIRLKDVK